MQTIKTSQKRQKNNWLFDYFVVEYRSKGHTKKAKKKVKGNICWGSLELLYYGDDLKVALQKFRLTLFSNYIIFILFFKVKVKFL